MPKIVIAGDWTMEETVGVHRFAHQILLALDSILLETENPMQITLLVPENTPFLPDFQRIRIVKRGQIQGSLQKHFWQQWVFPSYVRGQRAIGVDLALALPVWGCDICALHDCILERFPEGFQDHKLFRFLYLTKAKITSLRKKRRIITISQATKAELMAIYRISESRIHVLGSGWEHITTVQPDETIFEKIPDVQKERYFFSLGSKYKHKNFEWVLKTAAKNPQYQFVVSGDNQFSSAGSALESHKLPNVFFTGRLNDGELKALMSHCVALIQPSFYEGFGIPPLEALSLGRKIILSNTSCLPEIYADTAYYLDPHSDGCDLDSLLTQKVATPEAILNKFTWYHMAQLFLAVLESV